MRGRSLSRRRRAFSAAKSAPACEIAACVLERRGDLACPPSSLFHQARSIEAVIDPRRRTIGRRAIAPATAAFQHLHDAAMIARAMLSWIANTSCISRSNRSDQWLKPSATYEVGAAAVNIGRPLWTADPRSSPECATNGTAETCSELSMGPLI